MAFCIKYVYRELRFILYILFIRIRTRENKMADIVSDEENKFAAPKFTIDGKITRQYRRFNTVGTELTIRLLTPCTG